MTKVLIYTPCVGRGGVRRVIENLCASFNKQRGWSFDILGQTYDELGEKISYPAGWRFTQIRPVEKLPLHPHLFDFLMQHRSTFFEHLKQEVSDYDYDLIFAFSSWWGMDDTEPPEAPIISFIPDFAFDHINLGKGLTTYFRMIMPIVAKQSVHAIFPSDFQRLHGEDRYGFKGSTIYFSTDFTVRQFDTSIENRERVRQKYGLPERYVLAYHCYGHKGAETIIRAQEVARSMSAAVPPLVIAGLQTGLYTKSPPDNGHVRDVQRLIPACHGQIGRDVFIPGQIEESEIGGLYAGADVVVSATTSEGGINGTLIEGILARKPIICSDLEVFRERLSDGDVTYFPVGDYQALGKCIAEVCGDWGTVRDRAERLHKQFADYTMKNVGTTYLKVFKEVFHGKH
jgi:glycosyltransferase involved in cell wall biosynthesis